VVDKAFWSSFHLEEIEDGSFKLLCMAKFGRDGFYWRIPVGANKELFWCKFLPGKIDLEI
jgi:hypothetical protein